MSIRSKRISGIFPAFLDFLRQQKYIEPGHGACIVLEGGGRWTRPDFPAVRMEYGVNMRLIMIASPGKLDHYLEDFTGQMSQAGADARFQSLSALNGTRFPAFWHSSGTKRHNALRKLVRAEKPDILIFNASKLRFDFQRVREFFRGRIVVYDMEGPNFPAFSAPEWIRHVDLVVTTSRFSCRQLQAAGYSNVTYLPHGVNPQRFHPTAAEENDSQFCRERIFIGRPSPHRIECFEMLAKAGFPVTLYGKKWHALEGLSPELRGSLFPVRENVHGETLVRAVSGAKLFVNVQQDQFKDLHTLINMQVFIVSACRSCVLTEYIEELEEVLEPEREIAVYRNPDELCERVRFFHRNPNAAAAMAEAAYRRVLQEHTLEIRAREFLRFIREL